ncbi:MAG: hypothetical protein ACKVVP_10510 [Chloroflexota bacterium]
MAFTVSDFHDLVRMLEAQPEWRDDLRRLLLTEELLTLPSVVRELVDAQRRTEQRLGELATAQERTEQRLGELATAQERTEQRLGELATAQERTELRLGELASSQRELAMSQQKMQGYLDDLRGMVLEQRYQERAPAYFGSIILRTHALSQDERLEMVHGALEDGTLTVDQADDLLLADTILRGRLRADRREVYLVLEVSWGVGVDDVRRAIERAQLLARLGHETIPAVAGEWINSDAQAYAESARVWQVKGGRVMPPAAA